MSFLSRRSAKNKSTGRLTKKRNGRAKYMAFIETLEPRLLMSVPATFAPSGVGGGGWFGPAAINPHNSSEIWMPTDMGELFHSTDGGATWTFPSTSTISQFYRSPAQFTTLTGGAAGPMWAINAGSGYPSKSTDGGVTWTDATSWSPLSQGIATFLYTDPTPGSGVIVTSSETYNNTTGLFASKVYLSTNGGTSWSSSPIYQDSGGTTSTGYPTELLVSGLFKDGANIWISTSKGILYSSNTGTSFSMLTLPQNASVEDPSSMAVSKVGTTIRFVIVAQDPDTFTYNTTFSGGGFKHLYTADFSTTTQTLGSWTDITSHVPVNEEPTFAAMAAGNITTVYLGGLNVAPGWGVPSVLKTTTGGSTWSFTQTFQSTHNANVATNQVGDGEEFDYGTAGGAFSLQIDSADVNRVIITDNFTAWMTTDGGTGGANTTVANADWKDITAAPAYLHLPNTVGVAGSTAYAGSADNTAIYNLTFLSPTNVFASMTDNTGIYSTDGGNTWYYPTYNSGAFFSNFFNVTADYTTNVLFASAGKQNDLYKNWRLQNGNRDERGGGVDFSTDGGKTWSLLKQFASPDGETNPVAKFVIDPNVAGRAYALVANSTTGGIWVTNNLYMPDGKTVNTAATWTELTSPTRTISTFTYGWNSQVYTAGTYTAHDPNDLTILNDGTLVATFDETQDPTASYLLPTSGVWVSTNGGTTWTDRTYLDSTQSSMMFYTQHLTLDPSDSSQNTWYASVDYSGNDYNQNNIGVFKTTNRGVTWIQLFNPGGDDLGASNVAINPDTTSPDMYVASGNGGVYYSATKASGSFSAVTQDPYGDIESVAFNPYRTTQVWITTHGNGVQKGDTATAAPSNLTAVGNTGSQVTLNWSAVSGADSYLVQYTTGAVNWQGGVTWTQYGSPLGTGSTTVNINSLAAGLYYFRIVPKTGSTIDGYSNIVAGPVLAAATNVVATSDSPYEVDIAWQYAGAALGTQFQIQRSTNSTSWTVIGTTASSSILSYADTTASPNTFYYYRIQVIVAAGSFSSVPSTYSSAKTIAAGTLIAYDGFEYGAGSTLNNQGVAGNNWAGAWTASSSSVISATGLTPPVNLAGNGDSVGGDQSSGERDTTSTLVTYGTTIWASVLIKADTSTHFNSGYITVGNSRVEYHDYTGSGGFEWTIESADNSWWGTTWSTGSVGVTNGATYFVVLEETFNAGNDSVRAWINPTPGSTAPSDASSFDYKTGVNAGGGLKDIKLTSGYYANTQFDEVRVATTYAGVAPIALPAAPAGLSASTISTTQINLAWTSQTLNTSGYNIYKSTDGATFTFLGTSATASYSATGLTAGTTYYFQVTAYNASSNESGYSNRASATTTAGAAPAAPSGLSATAASSTQINLAWTDNASNETGFKVYQSTNGTTFTLLQTINTPNTTSYNVTGLSASTQYWYKVTAFNTGNESGYSNTATTTTLAASGLIASDSFAYSAGGLNGQGTAGSGWAGAWSTDNSSIVYNSTGLTSTVNLATSGGSVTEGTTGGTSTRNLSSALNSNGTTLWASALIKADTSTAATYGAFEIGNVEIEYHQTGGGTYEWTMQSVDGTWWGTTWNSGTVGVTNGTTYLLVAKITYNSGSDSVRVWLNPTPGSTAPSDGSSFDYKTAVNAGGSLTAVKFTGSYYANSGFDEVRLGTTFGDVAPVGSVVAPAAPSGLTATAASQTQINLAWTDNATTETGFKVYQSTNGTTFTLAQTINTPNTTSYNVTGLTANTQYWYKVTAFNTGGESSYSNTATTTTLVNVPTAPSGLTATAASQTQINLAWTDNATTETGFKVYQSTNGTTFTLAQTINTPNTTSYNVTGLSGSTQYWYKVTAFNAGGESSYSNTANTTTLVSGLIASDNFAYSTGGLNGQGTAGSGWAGAWSTDNSSIVYNSTGLTSTVNLATSGGSVTEGTTGGTSTRNLSSALNSNGTTLWASALIKADTSTAATYGAFEIGNVEIEYHQTGGGTYEWTMQSVDGTWWGTTWNSGTVGVTNGTTYLLVAKITYNSGSDSVRVWLNPTPGSTAPSDGSSFDYKTAVNAGGSLTAVKFTGSYYANSGFDEVRLGTTFGSVAPSNLPASLKALWRLDEGSGTVANDTDIGGVADTGTVNGTPTEIAAKVGEGLTLNGTSQYVQAANSTDLNISGTGFTTALWVKSAAATWNSTEAFISKGNQYKFGGVTGGKNIEFSLYIGGAWSDLTYTNSGDISTSWHHYAATYDGANMRIWVDGVNVASKAQTGSIGTDTNVLYLGRIGSSYLSGSIDEARVYNAALGSSDISALYGQVALSITGLTVSSAHSSSYSVQSYALATGISQYGDQTKNFTTVPSKYLGSTFIRTAEADSTSTAANLVTFTVNQPVIVYVAFDDAITTKPAWLTSQFTDTGDNIVSAEGTFSVYAMTVSSGTITLGGAGGTSTQGMYSVFFQNVL